MIEALQGNSLQTLFVEESGDTALAGFGSDATATQVRTSVFIDVLAVDFAPVVNPINLSANLVFTPSSGDYFLGTDGGGGPFFDTIWTGNLFVDLTALLASKGVVGAATKIGVNLDNRLSASSEAGTSAVIAKKDLDTTGFGISVGAPEPSALALAGLLAATAVLRRRSSRRV
jgi:hypothetical protein